ncbi:hypothetical protein B0T14DRAFT_571695 [Immersiella caudata]|uniref:Uncharacterized protein n=1 Tax=Immersiella caudata TaxID=314043 RepID=A0AA39U692_9PEZI|nr:hypothetical protein B0T14DRAFT_571695 [Immersiella caudata]
MSYRNTSILAYEGVVVAANAISFIALAGLGVLVLRNANLKHHSGAVREGFLWFKFALPLTAIVFLFSMAVNATQLAAHASHRRSNSIHNWRLSYVSSFLDATSLAVLMSSIARLITGTKMAVKQQGGKAYRIFIDVLSVLIILLGFALMVIYQVARGNGPFLLREERILVYGSMGVAIIGLLVIGGLANTISSWIERHGTRRDAGGAYKAVGNYIAAIASVNFLVFIWSVVGIVFSLLGGAYNWDPIAWFVADTIITRILSVLVFVLIYKLGKRQEGGLWLTTGPEAQGLPKSSNEISVTQV